MEEKQIVEKNVPYLVFESTISRMDRTIKRLWILAIVLIVLLVGTNIAWLYYESQFETVEETTTTQTVTQKADGDSNNSFIGGDSNVGEADGKDKDNKKKD